MTLKTLELVGGDRHLPPGVVELGPGVHQVEPVLQRDPLAGQEQVLELVARSAPPVPAVDEHSSRTDRPSMTTSSSSGSPATILGEVVARSRLGLIAHLVDLVEDLA